MGKVREKVYVVGMGMVSPLGYSVEENWEKLCKGANGIKKISGFDAGDLDTKIAGEVPRDHVDERIKKLMSRREYKQMTKNTKMGMLAVEEAISSSGILDSDIDKTRVATIMGIISTNNNEMDEKYESNYVVKTMPNSVSAWTSIRYGFKGPNFNVSSACASSAYAIILGQHMITSGMADIVVVGGADASVEEKYIRGFNQILALSSNNDPESACRPFTADRDGFVMSEGAGAMILESAEHAKKRNAKIYGELLGSAYSSEAVDITAPQEDGVGMCETMQQALADADIEYDQIDYINAHGTSTYLNDKYETMGIKKCFMERQKEISISSTKSMLGHTVAACGAIESIVTILSLIHGKITPTINYDNPDPELDLDYTPNVCRERDINIAMSNSFGFGGHNACIIYKKYQ